MSEKLTSRQRDCLQAIRTLIKVRGYSPTLQEISDAIGAKSTASAYYLVSALIEKGCITRHKGVARTIALCEGK